MNLSVWVHEQGLARTLCYNPCAFSYCPLPWANSLELEGSRRVSSSPATIQGQA